MTDGLIVSVMRDIRVSLGRARLPGPYRRPRHRRDVHRATEVYILAACKLLARSSFELAAYGDTFCSVGGARSEEEV